MAVDGTVSMRGDESPQHTTTGQRQVGGADLAVRFDLHQPRFELGLRYRPSYERRLDEGDLDGFHQDFALGLRGLLGERTTFALDERVVYGDETSFTRIDEPARDVVTLAGKRLGQELTTTLAHQVSRRTGWQIGVTQLLARFDDPRLNDTQELSLLGTVDRTIARDRHATAEVGARRIDLGAQGTADAVLAGVGYALPIGRDVSVRIGAGAYRARVDEEGLTAAGTHVGWRGLLTVDRRGRRVDWRALYRHDLGGGAGLGEITASDELLVGVGGGLTTRLHVGAAISYHRNEALNAATENLALLDAEAHLDVAIAERAGLVLGGSWIDQESSFPAFADLAFARYFVGLRLGLLRRGDPSLVTGALDEPPWQLNPIEPASPPAAEEQAE